MKFKKILLIGFEKNNLEQKYWDRMNLITEGLVTLPKDSNDIPKHLSTSDCLLVKLGATVDKKTMDNASKLKYIGMLGTGYGRIDTQYAAEKGITVTNVPGYSREAVAELVIGMILSCIRELEKARKRSSKGDYSDSGYSASEIKDKTFGIIGLGRNGSRVAEIALGFGANVIYWSRNRKKEFEARGISYGDIDSVISKSDFLSLHLSLNKDTENFLNEKRIMQIKKGAIFVNTSPMELVDINALEKRLKEGNMTFILDHSDEMKEEDLKKLSEYDNCMIYPPIGYITREAAAAKQDIFIQNMENFLKGSPTNKVS